MDRAQSSTNLMMMPTPERTLTASVQPTQVGVAMRRMHAATPSYYTTDSETKKDLEKKLVLLGPEGW